MKNRKRRNLALIGLEFLDVLAFFVIFHLFAISDLFRCKANMDELRETFISNPQTAIYLILWWIIWSLCIRCIMIEAYKMFIFPKTRKLLNIEDRKQRNHIQQILHKKLGRLFLIGDATLFFVLYFGILYWLIRSFPLIIWIWLAPLIYTCAYMLCNALLGFSLSIFNRKRTSKSELFQVPNKSDFLILGGPGSGCMSTLFCVNGTQWKLPHIEKCSFDDALKYEDNVWRLATLEDFSLLNKCAKYMGGRDKRTINIRIDEFSFYLEPRYWTGNAPQIGQNRADVAVQYYPTGFQPFYEHLPDIDTEKKAGVILVKR